MKTIFKLFFVISFVVVLIQFNSGMKGEDSKTEKMTSADWELQESEIKLPWAFGGFKTADQFHLRFYYVFREALDRAGSGEMTWQDSIKNSTGIVEIWFKNNGKLFRLDRYFEKIKISCDSYEGDQPDTISHEGITYTLYNRIIQKGLSKTEYTLTSRSNKICRFEKDTSKVNRETDQELALSLMTRGDTAEPVFFFYFSSSAASKSLETLDLELLKLTKPLKYKKIIQGWKEKQTIAGRTAIKNYNAAPIFGGGEGFQLIDTELGIGLIGYIEGYRDLSSGKKFQFKEPSLVFKALVVEITVSDETFEKF